MQVEQESQAHIKDTNYNTYSIVKLNSEFNSHTLCAELGIRYISYIAM